MNECECRTKVLVDARRTRTRNEHESPRRAFGQRPCGRPVGARGDQGLPQQDRHWPPRSLPNRGQEPRNSSKAPPRRSRLRAVKIPLASPASRRAAFGSTNFPTRPGSLRYTARLISSLAQHQLDTLVVQIGDCFRTSRGVRIPNAEQASAWRRPEVTAAFPGYAGDGSRFSGPAQVANYITRRFHSTPTGLWRSARNERKPRKKERGSVLPKRIAAPRSIFHKLR
jgi:hypothetical protein